ncbi:hypothetical protein Arub01_11280 [Actinomadura rubrobrunea]|uniref:Molecular chaperone DnaJ n=1 Tax=Actinomadura rubrobrunea TaxID=115335 RepID=A0A9W6UTL6_9ACTN|nr:molecular chaperone DnaJ [Actinomadura rubrobrunea]GLW62884.1 hypothetical protein Arub01_11280 [Actinomadura rubrobrunea]
MLGAGDARRRGRGAQAAAAAAAEARDAAAAAFYEMDQAQKYVEGRMTLFADLDGTAAAPMRAEFERIDGDADAAAAGYIAIVDAHDLSVERTPAEYDAARRAFIAAADRIREVTARLDGFAERLAPMMERLEAQLDRLPPRLAAARDAVAAADAAVARAREAGFDAAEAEAEAARARATLETVSAPGLGGLGLAGAIDAAEEARRIAERAREAAEELPRQAEKVRHGITSVRTRADAVAGRVETVRQAMRRLLRGYTQACWQDLRGAPEAVEAAVERARERLAEAAAHADRAEWRRAQQALTAARTELNAADRRAGQVTERAARLEEAAADPGKPAEAARFAVRDAQRLAVTGPGGPAPHHARALDALVERLEKAPELLTGVHPDYWAYLRELDAIKTAAGDVVARIRAERAAGS